jgi:hypothetical protein
MAGGGEQAPHSAAAAALAAATGGDQAQDQATPVVESPSISAEWPTDGEGAPTGDPNLSVARDAIAAGGPKPSKRRRPKTSLLSRRPALPTVSLTTACAAMGALLLALTIWRADVVRLLPQTAAFYKMVGFDVNLRGLVFKDVKITTESVEGKPVLVIEGVIIGEAKKPVELPRLRFSVRDAQGSEIYAWNSVLEQPVLKPGEKAWFKSRLASPPPEGRAIDVRFFNKRDIASGGI